jgi:hypothetical protein
MEHISFWFMLMMLIYWEEVYILCCIKENTEALIVARKTGQEVNIDKSKYMAIFKDQNAGRSHSMKTDNRSFGGQKKSNICEKP